MFGSRGLRMLGSGDLKAFGSGGFEGVGLGGLNMLGSGGLKALGLGGLSMFGSGGLRVLSSGGLRIWGSGGLKVLGSEGLRVLGSSPVSWARFQVISPLPVPDPRLPQCWSHSPDSKCPVRSVGDRGSFQGIFSPFLSRLRSSACPLPHPPPALFVGAGGERCLERKPFGF